MVISRTLTRFINKETAGASVLMLMVGLALFLANSPLAPLYQNLLVQPLQHGVNDGLMVLFFLLVGLEVKREVVQGELSSRAQAILPLAAAVGGMLVPVIIYMTIVWGDAALYRGWAVPSATDIAFSLGVLAMLGKRVPLSLKIFLTAFAIVDDIGAVVIIGLFYSGGLDVLGLVAMLGTGAALYALNHFNISRILPYLVLGVVMWFATVHAGLHGTIAGVLTALAVPLSNAGAHRRNCALRHLEHMLHPWVIYAVLPLFALLNAGLVFDGMSLRDALAPLPLGIGTGLFFGKQLGIFAVCYALIKMGKAVLPTGATLLQLYGVAIFGGIGFTMSQFIAILAFPDPALANAIKLGVIGGSLLSAVWGLIVLRLASSRP